MGRRSRSASRSRSRSRSRRGGGSSDDGEGTRVHIGDVSVNCSKRDLEDEFKKFGPLSEVWMARTPPCFAFAVFRHHDDAEEAVRGLNGQVVAGSRIRVTLALPRARERNRRPNFDSSMRCYQCGDRGHFARDCYKVGRNRNHWSPPCRQSRSPVARKRRRSSSSKSSSRSRSRSRGDKSRHRRSEEDPKRSKDRGSSEKRSSSRRDKDKKRKSTEEKHEKIPKESSMDRGDNDEPSEEVKEQAIVESAGGDEAEAASPSGRSIEQD